MSPDELNPLTCVQIGPLPREHGHELDAWCAALAALPLHAPDTWKRDEYAAFDALIREGFETHHLSVIQGSCPRDNPHARFWRALVDQVTRDHALIHAGVCTIDASDPAKPLLRWSWATLQPVPNPGARVLIVPEESLAKTEHPVWVIDGQGKLLEQHPLDEAIHEKLQKHGLRLPAQREP